MIESADVIAPNSLLLVRDARSATIPPSMGGALVALTESCIAIGTREETEGPVRISFVEAEEGEALPALEILDHTLVSESGEVVLTTVLGDTLLIRRGAPGPVRLKVYVNHSTEPDEIAVLFP